MPTIGEALKANNPDLYKDEDPSAIDERVRIGMEKDPSTTLAKIKKYVPKLAEYDDADLHPFVVDHLPKPAQASTMSPDKALDIQRSLRVIGGTKQYATNLENSIVTKVAPGETDASRASAEEHVRTTMTPMEALKPRVREMSSQEMAAVPGGRVVNAREGWLGQVMPAMQVQNQTGQAVGQLDPGASREAVGPFDIGRLTGEASSLQQGAAALAAKAAGLDMGPGPVGMREVTEASARKRGAENPMEAAMGFNAASMALAPAALGLSGVDKAEEGILRAAAALKKAVTGEAPVLERWANDNAEEAAKYMDAARKLWQGADGIPVTPESAAEMAAAGGRTRGDIYSMVAPTEGSLGIPLVAGAAKMALGPTVRKAAGAAAEAFPKAAEFVSSLPGAIGLDPASHQVAKALQARARSAGDVFEARFLQDAGVDLTKAGVNDKGILTEALNVWHSPETRLSASPEAQKAIEVLQPWHEKSYRGVYGDAAQYNPFHVARGQDIAKANRIMESKEAQTAVEDAIASSVDDVGSAYGASSNVNKQYAAANLAGVPGINATRIPVTSGMTLADTAKTLKEADYLPRQSRAWESQKENFKNLGINKDLAEQMADMTASTGIAKTARLGAEARGLREKEVARGLADHMPILQQADPVNGRAVEQYLGMPIEDALAVMGRDQNKILRNEGVLRTSVIDKLAADKKVIVQVEGAGSLPLRDLRVQRALGGDLPVVVTLPKEFAAMNGQVWDRRFVTALRQTIDPPAMTKALHKGARELDRVLGMSGLNYVITRGNLGFEARNRISELVRLAVDDPAVFKKENQQLLKAIADAPIGAKGPPILNGMSAGELHEALLQYGGVGHGLLAEMKGTAKNVAPGPSWVPQKVLKTALAPARAAEVLQDKLVNQTLKRGLKLPEKYGADDGLKMLHVVNSLRQGSSLPAAMQSMKTLLIDYGDKTALEHALKPFIPFIKYYTGATRGLIEIAVKNPRKFARVYDLARILEHWDTSEHGGQALNQKLKTTQDVIGGAPLMQFGDTITSVRPETVASEVGGLLNTYQTGLMGDPETGQRGGLSLLGPTWSKGYELATGENLATGRNVLGVSRGRWDKINQGQGMVPGLPGKLLAALEQQRAMEQAGLQGQLPLGENPRARMASLLAQSALPVSPPVSLAARMYSGTANPASRAEETQEAQLRRSLMSYLGGPRSGSVDPSAEFSRQQKRKVAKPLVLQGVSEVKGLKATPRK